MMRTRTPRPAGFTLIELLVVIALIAALAAITAGAAMRVRASQMAKTNDMTVDKLQKALDQQWKATIDNLKATNTQNRVPQSLVTYCTTGDGKEQQRAHALWIYMNLRNEFPQNVSEAQSPVSIGGYSLQCKKTFATLANSGTTDEQGAACLFAMLNEKARGGAVSLNDDIMSATIETPAGRAFRDAYGQPITFRRLFNDGNEIQLPPFINPKNASKDPIDVDGLLSGWGPAASANTVTPRESAANLVGIPDQNKFGRPDFMGLNHVATVLSAGPNKVLENSPTGTTDDFWGYRLRRLGNKGD